MAENTGKVQVTQAVADGLEAVRSSGLTNMFDRQMVIHLLDEWEFEEAAEWVRKNRTKYAELIFHGLEVVED